MALNHTQITNAKPRAKGYKIADSGGLYLVVQPKRMDVGMVLRLRRIGH